MQLTSLKELPERQRKIIRAWCMYDWANSGFAASGVAAIFPVYFVVLFKNTLGEEASFLGMTFTASSSWSFGIALSAAVVALSSPVLGVIADRAAIKKTLMWVYVSAGSLFVALAFFCVYTSSPSAWLFGAFVLGNVGFSGSLVFYNSLLPHIAPRELLDDVSCRGFAYGYVGGGLLLVIHLAVILAVADTGVEDLVTRIAIASIGMWWFGWALWTLKVVPEPVVENAVSGLNPKTAVALAARELGVTFRELTRYRVVLVYLAAYLLFNDGIQTIMGIAGAFGADTLGIDLKFNMATILIIQFVAAGGAMLFSRLAALVSTKRALIVALVGWCLIVLFGVAIAPLVPTTEDSFDYLLTYDSDSAVYVVAEAPEIGDSVADGRWEAEVGALKSGQTITNSRAEKLVEGVRTSPNSRYSVLVKGGPSGDSAAVGALHPSTLGDGPVDWWPMLVRGALWAPLGIPSGFQFLILGALVGLVMGGSQALARSLFAQITPSSRSGEFFSFFGFMGKASSVFGPMLYVLVTGMFDTRVAITAILSIIVGGTLILRWVDVDAGARAADAEDRLARGDAAPAAI